MLTEIYIEALLVDEELADQVWDADETDIGFLLGGRTTTDEMQVYTQHRTNYAGQRNLFIFSGGAENISWAYRVDSI